MRNNSHKSKSKSQNFLEEIVKIKKEELSRKTQRFNESEKQHIEVSESPFLNALQCKNGKVKVIAEIKFASPTHPDLGSPEGLLKRAMHYEEAGADAISLITEKHFFKGDISFIAQVKQSVSLPVLQKDFVIDPVQIYEAKDAGSDALLLIARLVDANMLNEFVDLCFAEGIEPVVEINNEDDLKKAGKTKTHIIAVNARDLESFTIDVVRACMLIEKIPERFIKLGFSGVTSQKEVVLYRESGVHGILVGTGLMKTKNIKRFIKDLAL